MREMGWREKLDEGFDVEAATPREALEFVLQIDDPRRAEEFAGWLDRHGPAIESILGGRGRWAVLKGESLRGWGWGPLGFIGPMGVIAFAMAGLLAWVFELTFIAFLIMIAGSFVLLRLAVVKPDHRDRLAEGTKLGAGVVAAWVVRRQGESADPRYDGYLRDALVEAPEYWHDLAGRAVERLPADRCEKLVLDAFSRRPDDLWHLLPFAPTERVVRAALARGPRSSATADFHAFGALIRQATIEPVLEAIRAGAGNRDVLIRAVASSGNPAAADLLVATLSERNDRLRDVARDGLVGLGPSVLPRLFATFDSAKPQVQQAISRALRGLGANAEIERFCAEALRDDDVDELTASQMRRIVLTRRSVVSEVEFEEREASTVDEILASIPAPKTTLTGLRWRGGESLSDEATACLVDLVVSEGPDLRCGELSGIGRLLAPDSRHELMSHASEHGAHPRYRMVLADDAELLRHHLGVSGARQEAEMWVDVLERHGSLAPVHALDELWRTGVDGVVQTSAMAALMRMSGEYDGLEAFADRALHAALRDVSHPLHDPYARGQFSRFERMMVSGRRVSPETFWSLYATLPAQHVLWGTYDRAGRLRGTFRLDEEYDAVDADDEPFVFEPHVEVGVTHAAELGPVASSAWAEVFSDYELVPHFEQLQRSAYHLTADERAATLFRQFADRAPGGRLEAALIRRGWRPSPTDVETVYTFTKPVTRGRSAFTAVIEFEPGFGEDPAELQEIDCLAFWEGHHHVLSSVVTKVTLGEVESVIFSEIVLELRELMATAATGDERSLPSIPASLD